MKTIFFSSFLFIFFFLFFFFIFLHQPTFLDASTHLYMRVCPSVRPLVRPSVHPSIHPSVISLLKSIKNDDNQWNLMEIKEKNKQKFLDASSHLYKRLCWSIRRSVRLSVISLLKLIKNDNNQWNLMEIKIKKINKTFLDASSYLYKRLCLSVRPSVHPSVRPSVCPSVHPSIRPSVHNQLVKTTEMKWFTPKWFNIMYSRTSLLRFSRDQSFFTQEWGFHKNEVLLTKN